MAPVAVRRRAAGGPGRQAWQNALAAGRGVIASFVHSGPVPGLLAALAEVDRPAPDVVAGAWLLGRSSDAAEDAATRRRVARTS